MLLLHPVWQDVGTSSATTTDGAVAGDADATKDTRASTARGD